MLQANQILEGFEQHLAGFRRREEERVLARGKLESLLKDVAAAESDLSDLSIFGSEERYRLARARVELLRALRSIDRVANTQSEKSSRATEAFISGS